MKNRISIIMALGLTLILSSCGGGGGGNDQSAADIFVQSLNSLDASSLYQVVKATTVRGGSWIVLSKGDPITVCNDPNDPNSCYLDSVNNLNFAIDLSDPSRGAYGNDALFFNSTALGVGFDGSTGLYFDVYGNKYEKQGEVIKDLNVLGAEANSIKQFMYANEIQAKLGLSAERSITMAKMGMDLQYLAKKNGGTVSDKDAAAFEQFAFGGVKVKSVVEHMQSGNTAALDKDKETIANANGISADDVTTLILKSHF